MQRSRKTVFHSLPELQHLCDESRNRLWKHLEKTHWCFGWLPTIVGMATWLAWFLASCMLPNLLWDYPGVYPPAELGWIGDAMMLLATFGIATVLALFTGSVVQAHLLYRRMAGDLAAERCLWCSYSLVGLEREGANVRCPECGNHSPVRV